MNEDPAVQAVTCPTHPDITFPQDGYGSAIDSIYRADDGKLWVGNGEYGSQVNFCPECGGR